MRKPEELDSSSTSTSTFFCFVFLCTFFGSARSRSCSHTSIASASSLYFFPSFSLLAPSALNSVLLLFFRPRTATVSSSLRVCIGEGAMVEEYLVSLERKRTTLKTNEGTQKSDAQIF